MKCFGSHCLCHYYARDINFKDLYVIIYASYFDSPNFEVHIFVCYMMNINCTFVQLWPGLQVVPQCGTLSLF
jgi:hypothetical protein